jgi:hypothetical protein
MVVLVVVVLVVVGSWVITVLRIPTLDRLEVRTRPIIGWRSLINFCAAPLEGEPRAMLTPDGRNIHILASAWPSYAWISYPQHPGLLSDLTFVLYIFL